MNATLTITQLYGLKKGRTVFVRRAEIGPDGPTSTSAVITASENLAAGDLVNVYNNAGSLRVRQADATLQGREASGFVLAAVSGGQPATVYFTGRNDQQSGLTVGRAYLGTVAGRAQATPPVGAGQLVQHVGYATSATTLILQLAEPIRLGQ